jgi:integrase
MPRGKRQYRTWRRKDRGGKYSYKLPGKPWVSTEFTSEARLQEYLLSLLTSGKQPKALGSVRNYLGDFYVWEPGQAPKCPHCRRVLADGGQIGPEYARRQRKLLDRFVACDKLYDMDLTEVDRGVALDFRDRLIETAKVNTADRSSSAGKATVNLVLNALSAAFGELVDRQRLPYNPFARMLLKYDKSKRGTFTISELRKMFPADVAQLGPWPDLSMKTAFLMAATLGLRRNEVRAIRWHSIDLTKRKIRVHEAFKGEKRRPGKPKWDKVRETAIPGVTARHLAALRALAPDPDGFVFSDVTGSPRIDDWWRNSWDAAMARLKIKHRERNLVPHSLRHSLATELRAAGISDVLLKKSMGWSSDAMLENYSDHLQAEHFRGQAKLVDKLLG